MPARIALASYATGRNGIDIPPGDRLLRRALLDAGHRASQALWSSPTQNWRAFDAVIIRSCWDYHLRPQAFLDWIASLESARVPVVNAPALVRWNYDKRYLAALATAGIAIPDSVWLAAGESLDLALHCRHQNWPAAVVKPLISASAHRTRIRHRGLARGPALVQQFVPEIQTAGEWSLVFLSGQFSHAVRKLPASGDFRVQMEYGGSAVPGRPPAPAVAFARRALAHAPATPAFARVDIVLTASGPLLMELELIEPELFFPPTGHEAARAAAAILAALNFPGAQT